MSTQFAPIWNNASVDFSCIKANVTDTNSGSNSTLLDLQVGESSIFSIRKNGYISRGTAFMSLGVDASNTIYFGNPSTGVSSLFGFTQGSNIFTVRGNAGIGWSSGANDAVASVCDLYLSRDAAGTLAQRNGINGQTFRIYNTYSSATSYERGKFEWSSDAFRIGTEKGSGGGSARSIEFQTDGTTRLTIGSDGSLRIPTSNSSSSFILRSTVSATTGINIGTNGDVRIGGLGVGIGLIVADGISVYGPLQLTGGTNGYTKWHQAGSSGVPQTGIVEQRYATAPQSYRLYGTYTDASNYRRLSISSTTDGAFTISAEGAGTGASGNGLNVYASSTSNLIFGADSASPVVVISGSSEANNPNKALFGLPNDANAQFQVLQNYSTYARILAISRDYRMAVGALGTASTISINATMDIRCGTGTDRALIVKGATSQSAALTEWQNSSGTVLASIGSGGVANFNNTLDLTIRTVTYGATMAIDAALGNKVSITLTGNGTISNPTNAVDGRVLVFRLRQDGSGNRVPVWDTKYAFVGDLATVTLSTAANSIDRVAFEYDATDDKWYCISFLKGS